MTCLYSWNVNGLRAVLKNGFMEWFQKTQPDILCLQESRLLPEEAPRELFELEGYHIYWSPAVKRGYSGTATFTRIKPDKAVTLECAEFDEEGRAQLLHFKEFILVNTYWPNSQDERKRLSYKLAFCEAIGNTLDDFVKAGKNVIICGDFNIAHTEIDLARPKQNENNAGYYIEERDAMTDFLARGYVDVFRKCYPDKVAYSWWSYRGQARVKNIGWRLDYFCMNKKFFSSVEDIRICDEVTGSDHCPVALHLKTEPSKRRKEA
jgi:exodeoxyribonuclease III